MELNEPTKPTAALGRPLHDTALATLVVLLLLLGFALLLSVRNVLASVFLGLLLATALRPLVSRLRAWRVPGFAAASAAILLLIGAVVGAIMVVVPLVARQAGALQAAVPSFYSGARDWLLGSDMRLLRQLGSRLEITPPTAPAMDAGDLTGQAMATLPALGYLAFVTACTLIFAYYWLLYRERSVRGLLLLLPMERRAGAEAVWAQIEERIGDFLRGQLILAVTVGSLSLVGYWVAGVPYALLLAVIAGVLEMIPFIGPFIAIGVAVAVSLSEGPQQAIAALIVGTIVQQLENNFLAPRVMDETVGVSPVVTLLAFVGFAALFGPVGALLAIPLAATLQVLFVAWIERRATADEVMPAGRAMADKLRYSAREMAADIAGHLRAKDDAAHAAIDESEERLERILLDLDVLLAGEAAEQGVASMPLALEVAR